jgi:hypothetical protein
VEHPNRRRMRGQLGSRTNRRNGTKSGRGFQQRPKSRMKALLARYARGEIDRDGREP